MQVIKCPSKTYRTDYLPWACSVCANHYQKRDAEREEPLVSHNMTVLVLTITACRVAIWNTVFTQKAKDFFFLLLSPITSQNRFTTGEKGDGEEYTTEDRRRYHRLVCLAAIQHLRLAKANQKECSSCSSISICYLMFSSGDFTIIEAKAMS